MPLKIKVLKLGSVCKDKGTGLKGTLTHWVFDMGHRVDYLFQPKGLNPEDGQPVKKSMLELERLQVSDDQFEEVEVPVEILGTTVTNDASGFTGMAVVFVMHINGCFHVAVQPSGVLEKTNTPIQRAEFDLRELSGKMIAKLDADELKQSKKEKPSPASGGFEKLMPAV